MHQRIIAAARHRPDRTGRAVELNPKAITVRQADDIKWRVDRRRRHQPNPVRRSDQAFYMVMNRGQPGNFSKPHFIPTTVSSRW